MRTDLPGKYAALNDADLTRKQRNKENFVVHYNSKENYVVCNDRQTVCEYGMRNRNGGESQEMKILFTGFEPFGGEKINPSWEAVKLLPDRIGKEIIVARRQIPVEYESVRELLKRALLEEKPDAVICTGQAGGRASVTPEVIAINLADSGAPDNRGIIKTGTRILPDGPAAYFSTLPVREMTEAMQKAGIPASLSYSAGVYVCNTLMYHLMDLLAAGHKEVQGGFIHFPYTCTQAAGRNVPSLPLEQMVRSLIAAADVVGQGTGDGSLSQEGTGDGSLSRHLGKR